MTHREMEEMKDLSFFMKFLGGKISEFLTDDFIRKSSEFSKLRETDYFDSWGYPYVHSSSLKDVLYKFGELGPLPEDKSVFYDQYSAFSEIPKTFLVPLKADKDYFEEKYGFFLWPLKGYIEETDMALIDSFEKYSPTLIRRCFEESTVFVKESYKKKIEEIEKKLSVDSRCFRTRSVLKDEKKKLEILEHFTK